MAKDRVKDLVTDLFEAFDSGGVEASLAYLDPEISWCAPPDWLEQRLYKGHAEVRELANYWAGQFDHYRIDIEEVKGLGADRALALGHQRGRIRDSGGSVDQEIGYVVLVQDGLVKRVDVYFSWAEARQAAGLA